HDRDSLPGPSLERDVLDRVLPSLIGEGDVVKRDPALRAADVDRVGRLLDLGFLVEQRHHDAQEDELLVKVADHVADRLERDVDRRYVREQDEQLTGGDLPVYDVQCPEAEHERSSRCGRGRYAEREERLADGQRDAGVHGGLALGAETPELEAYAPERDDQYELVQSLV